MTIKRKLRVGILCKGLTFPAYEATIIQDILSDDRFELAYILTLDYEKSNKANHQNDFKNTLWKLYSKRLLFPKLKSIRPCSLNQELKDTPTKHIILKKISKYSYVVDEKDLDEIRNQNHSLDVILNFQYAIIKGSILGIPRYGVWSFHHDDEQKYRGGPAGFWEIYHKDVTSGAILQVLSDKLDAGIILRKGHFKTNFISLAEQKDRMIFQSGLWVMSCLRELSENPQSFKKYVRSTSVAPIYRDPTNLQMLKYLVHLMYRKIFNLFNNFFLYEEWNVGLIDEDIARVSFGRKKPIQWMHQLPWPKYAADPFGFVGQDGKQRILFEIYDEVKGKGIIGTQLYENRDIPAISALNTDHHLSYPFILDHEGKRYCIPESLLSKTIQLYKVTNDGKLYDPVTLLSGKGFVDPTLFFYQGKFWIFCTLSGLFSDANTSLFIYHSDKIEGPYIPHLLNPVKTDVRNTRPAGTPFIYNGQLFRPAQNCSYTYGGEIAINRLIKLSITEFHEETISEIKPDSLYRDGTHHLASIGDRVLIDGKRFRYSFKPFFHRVLRRHLKTKDLTNLQLEPYNGNSVFSFSSEFSKFFAQNGIDEDGWARKKANLYFLNQEFDFLEIECEFPGWSNLSSNRLSVCINNRTNLKRKVHCGNFVLKVGPFLKNSLNEINFRSHKNFRMPGHDERERAIRIVSIRANE